ncbi:MAG: hypothetical protein GY807_10195 [Gammaproteobacteria bacterium]|nr:hypothetical protein [Gammaproteobacteria bacterium]
MLETPQHDTVFMIGILDGVLYTATRDGKDESYVHEFKPRARPILASSFDGNQLYVIDGQYLMTERGIVDQ